MLLLGNMQCNVLIGLNCRFLAHDLLNNLGLSAENSHNKEENCHHVKTVPEIIRYGSTLDCNGERGATHWSENWISSGSVNCQILSRVGLLVRAGSCPMNRHWFLWLSNQKGLGKKYYFSKACWCQFQQPCDGNFHASQTFSLEFLLSVYCRI